MSHYYTNEETPDVPSSFTFDIAGRTYDMQSNAGVFSKDKLDEGTRILLETVLTQAEPAGPVLDMGCGIGPVAKVLAVEWQVPVTASMKKPLVWPGKTQRVWPWMCRWQIT